MLALSTTAKATFAPLICERGRKNPVTWRLVFCGAFLAAVAAWAGGIGLWLAIAAVFGGYLALNIGANDVANNIGPTVGARVMPLGAAVAMAAACEAAGAMIAGGDVVNTIRKGIIDPALIPGVDIYVWAMMAALLAAALWLNLATLFGAPVSTTHSIVGGVLGAGVAAAGFGVVHWSVLGGILASWVISPAMGAGLAALCLILIKRGITWQPDILGAAGRGVPLLAAAMAWVFSTYLLLMGLPKSASLDLFQAGFCGLWVAGAVWLLMRTHVARRLPDLRNCKNSLNRLLGIPLILAAGALSFAHGSNDVANAIGPLAGIVEALATGKMSNDADVPLWVLGLGALGLALGLVLFGPRLIRTVGSEITRLDAVRAYCIAMAATLTVILASQLGVPVSTTHVSVGALLGVGFLRERLKAQHQAILAEIRASHSAADHARAEEFIVQFHATPFGERAALLAHLRSDSTARGAATPRQAGPAPLGPSCRRVLVNRALVLRIIAAWVITVPATATFAGLIYFTLRGMMLP
ncbi:inorganic phosphate transporter [Phaeovulum sp.]|uniref:inorganic phosphate transporter n=1 Tax=Phaeovulum sp. TaxID=2934796 RepID=UPI0039E56C4C